MVLNTELCSLQVQEVKETLDGLWKGATSRNSKYGVEKSVHIRLEDTLFGGGRGGGAGEEGEEALGEKGEEVLGRKGRRRWGGRGGGAGGGEDAEGRKEREEERKEGNGGKGREGSSVR